MGFRSRQVQKTFLQHVETAYGVLALFYTGDYLLAGASAVVDYLPTSSDEGKN
jgi:hypothetical protein